MAWDTEGTRRRLKEAATAEFAEHGPDGTTMARIAERAGDLGLMETAPLKSFATWAHAALIREVTARIAVVLAPASPERVEQPKAAEALEQAVSAAGGGEKGRATVADRVAYTWFNRIITLRFMDANGYTGIGVVSGRPGAEGAQPEILAEAERGNLDAAVVGARTRELVAGLLSGTRRSNDAQGEAYALLLADYCRHWNRAMPFMFEREGDVTELLIPASLLADGSVLRRAARVLTVRACQDVEVIGWLYQFYISEHKGEVFAGFKQGRKAGADEIPVATQLFTPHWIVRYLVENSLGRIWMLNRPSSRLAGQLEYYIAPAGEDTDFLKISGPEELTVIDPACGSGHMLTYAFDLLYAIYEEEGYSPSEIPGLILARNLRGVEIDPRAGALAAFALTMKARARKRTFFSEPVEPRVCVLAPISFTPQEIGLLLTCDGGRQAESAFWNQFEHADTFGSLIQPDPHLTARLRHQLAGLPDDRADVIRRAERVVTQADYLTSRYSVVVANPPYMGAGSMGEQLITFAREAYPRSKFDLYAMFIERVLRLGSDRGLIAMITMQTWLFLSTYEKLRETVLDNAIPVALAHLGTRAFDSIDGEVVSTVAFVLEKGTMGTVPGRYIRLTSFDSGESKSAALRERVHGPADDELIFERDASYFRALPGAPFAFWLDPGLVRAFDAGTTLRAVLRPKIGMRTGDNERFLRRWFEVGYSSIAFGQEGRASARSAGRRWFPYNKGGGLRRWYGNQEFVVDWLDDGRDIKTETLRKYPQLSPDSLSWKISNEEWYFRESITWSDITTSGFAARYSPQGFLFDVKGSSGFPVEGLEWILLALLNSRVAHEYMAALNPSTTIQVGDIAKVPLADIGPAEAARINDNTLALVDVARRDWDAGETSWGFRGLPLIPKGSDEKVSEWVARLKARWAEAAESARALEIENESLLSAAYGFSGTHQSAGFEYFRPENHGRDAGDFAGDLVSYSVGCMFGRYSLDQEGIVLADGAATLQDYLARVPSPTFAPDQDNVIPIVDGDWFEDDIVARFRAFLRVTFGEHQLEENLRFVTESLGVRDVRDYFVKSFYKDHVQRYRKRPVYWLFSSRQGSFNALIYLHRYTPSTSSTVLNEYLREYKARLTSSLRRHERLAAADGPPRRQAAAQNESGRLRKVLAELDEYDRDVLSPLASRQLAIDLDAGVKANYPKFGAALRKIPGLEAGDG